MTDEDYDTLQEIADKLDALELTCICGDKPDIQFTQEQLKDAQRDVLRTVERMIQDRIDELDKEIKHEQGKMMDSSRADRIGKLIAQRRELERLLGDTDDGSE